MANVVAVKGLGTVVQKVRDGADLIVVLLQASGIEDDSVLRKYATLDDVLNGGSSEANFTNYARKVIANEDIVLVEDASGAAIDLQMGDLLWIDAGGDVDNNLARLLVCEDGGTDEDRTLLTIHEFVVTTGDGDGGAAPLYAREGTDGFYRAA